MLGNDLVDLGDPEAAPGAQHAGFDRRVFSARERERIAGAPDPMRMRWLLWAAKEAAYKALKRGQSALVFSPVAFRVHWPGPGYPQADGRVRHGAQVLSCRSHAASPAYVHVLCTLPGTRVRAAEEKLAAGDDPGWAARRLAARLIDAARPARIRIASVGKLPQATCDGAPTGHIISLSHHGAYVAAAVWAPPPAVGHRGDRRADDRSNERVDDRLDDRLDYGVDCGSGGR